MVLECLVAVRLQFLGDEVDGCRVTKNAESTDDADCLVAQEAAVPELFSGVDVANVNLQEWDRNTCEGIAKSHARVCETAWVDDDKLSLSAGIVDSVDNGAFMVGLEIFDFDSEVFAL